MTPTPRLTSAALLAAGLLLLAPGAGRADEAADPHARHHHLMGSLQRATRTTADYAVPPIELVRDDGATVSLPAELDDGRPVVLDFIYTTCTTICPVLSQTFARLQERLGAERGKVHLVSITIDPEEDTPARLAAYARRFGAGAGWRLYTGTAQACVAAQKAFGAYRGDKMDHTPATFLRAAPGQRWVRLDGFATPDELARELHGLVAAR